MKLQRIIRFSIEILSAILIALFSYDTVAKHGVVEHAYAYDNKNIILNEINPLELSNIYPMDNSEALNNYETAHYQMINNDNTIVNYKIVYKVNNNINPNWFNYYLKISGVEMINKFSNLNQEINDDYIEITLYEGVLDKYETIDFEYLIWLDSEVGNEAQNKSFNGQIVAQTY